MSTATPSAVFGEVSTTELLDLVASEFAGSLELLTALRLEEAVAADEIANELPRGGDEVRVALRIGIKGPGGPRLGFVSMPLACSLVLAGSLLMLPVDTLRASTERDAPDGMEKEAMMEIGHLLGSAFDTALRERFGEQIHSRFAGCQGVPGGESPWIPGYAGEPLAIRRQKIGVSDIDPFEILIAIPV